MVKLLRASRIRTAEDEVIDIPDSLISESDVLKNAFKSENEENNDSEIKMSVTSDTLRNIFKIYDSIDMAEPYVSVMSQAERLTFQESHSKALKFLKELSHEDVKKVTQAADNLKIMRVIDLCAVFFQQLCLGKTATEIRELLNFGAPYPIEEEETVPKAHKVQSKNEKSD